MERLRTVDVVDDETSAVDFASMFLSAPVYKGLQDNGYLRPSPIQLKAIPLGRLGLDVIAQSKSGTGKTLVFVVIALEMVDVKQQAVQALILCPTREIAVQSTKVILDVGKFIEGLQCRTFIGGSMEKEDAKQAKKCHIVIGSPGRIKQLIEIDALSTGKVRLLVLDEADRLTEGSLQVQCNEIFRALPERKQICAFSATYTSEALAAVKAYMRNPVMISLIAKDQAALHGVKEYFQVVQPCEADLLTLERKKEDLLAILGRTPFYQCIVFCNEMAIGEEISYALCANGFPARFICGKQEQVVRTQTICDFADLSVRILVSTDLTSRGIDMSKVNVVVNLDLPYDQQTYVHRTGRTGRFGTYGLCINLLTHSELKRLEVFRKNAGAGVAMLELPKRWNEDDLQYHANLQQSLEETQRAPLERFEDERQKVLADPKQGKKRKIVTADAPLGRNERNGKRVQKDYSSSSHSAKGAVTLQGPLEPGVDDCSAPCDADGSSSSAAVTVNMGEGDSFDATGREHLQTGDIPEQSGNWSQWHLDQVQKLHHVICQYYDAHYRQCYFNALQQAKGTSSSVFVFRDYAAELRLAIPASTQQMSAP